MPGELAVVLDHVRAHPHQRRGVRVHRERGLAADVGDTVDVRRADRERLPGPVFARLRRAAEAQPLVAHPAADHVHRAQGEVVVLAGKPVSASCPQRMSQVDRRSPRKSSW